MKRFALLSSLAALLAVALTGCATTGTRTVKLFNGKNLDGWYSYTTTTKFENPGCFQVRDGMIFVAGGQGTNAWFGGLVTKEEFSDYKLTFDYKWGGPTYGSRFGKSRDAGVLLHCVGPNEPGPWMTSYEFQIIEGGTGDILVVNYGKKGDHGEPVTLTLTSEGALDGKQKYFKPGGESLQFTNSGRLNWWGRDPKWTDTLGYRGPKDVEAPFGEWTHCEILCRADTLTYYVNGKLVNAARNLSVTKGKIFFQTEGAEVWYRNLELTPLK